MIIVDSNNKINIDPAKSKRSSSFMKTPKIPIKFFRIYQEAIAYMNNNVEKSQHRLKEIESDPSKQREEI